MDVIGLFKRRFVVIGFLKILRGLIAYFAPGTRLAQWFQNPPRHPLVPFELDFMQRCSSDLLKWWRGPPARLALIASPFKKLPFELIIHIANFLPPESATSLAISCYTLHSCLEIQYLRSLKQAECSILIEFLQLLERDLPGHILCPHCNKFHAISSAELHLPSRHRNTHTKHWLACWKADNTSRLHWATHSGFSSTIFRMAMKAERQGRDTSNLINLLSISYNTASLNRSGLGYIEQSSALARIYRNSLLLREQRIFMIPSSQNIPVPPYSNILICHHIEMLGSRLYTQGIEIPYSHEIERYENRQNIIYCKYCHTEFRIDFKSYGEIGNAMFVTKWVDVGKGQDPMDLKWRTRDRQYTRQTESEVTYQRGSICAAFEQKRALRFKFDSLLTAENEKAFQLSPGPWPEGCKVSFDGATRYWTVRDGRFVFVNVQDLY